MATGDQADIAGRLRSTLPGGWFPLPAAAGAPSTTPVLDGVLAGIASGFAQIYALLTYTRAQARLSTSTTTFLDMSSTQFYGGALPRLHGEADAAFRARIRAAMFPPSCTRAVVSAAVQALTGTVPTILEPDRPTDTGGWGSRTNPTAGGGFGLSSPGMVWGSRTMSMTFFVATPAGASTPAAIAAAVAKVAPGGSAALLSIS